MESGSCVSRRAPAPRPFSVPLARQARFPLRARKQSRHPVFSTVGRRFRRPRPPPIRAPASDAAHVAIQVARHWKVEVYAATREARHQKLALGLGAAWAGGTTD